MFTVRILPKELAADACSRHRMIIAGLSSIVAIEIYTAVMQRQFQGTNNQLGKAFTVLGIYLFVIAFCALPVPDPLKQCC